MPFGAFRIWSKVVKDGQKVTRFCVTFAYSKRVGQGISIIPPSTSPPPQETSLPLLPRSSPLELPRLPGGTRPLPAPVWCRSGRRYNDYSHDLLRLSVDNPTDRDACLERVLMVCAGKREGAVRCLEQNRVMNQTLYDCPDAS